MTKSNKHKGARRSEDQKIKLKVGRKIPKGNVTNTTFKTKKIQIVNQLERSTSVTEAQLNRFKKDINSLLIQLNHHNASSRNNSLSALKETLQASTDLIHKHLCVLVDSVCPLITDDDLNVRVKVQAVLQLMFSNIPATHIMPFFQIIAAHLSCGLSHISRDIQQSSLSVFDLIIETYPDLLMTCSKTIMESFLNLVSQEVMSSGKPKNEVKATPKQRLDMNLSSNVFGFKWHHQVFQRLEQFLLAILAEKKCSSDEDYGEKIVKWSHIDPVGITVNSTISSQILEKSPGRSQKFYLCELIQNQEQFQSLVGTIMPLMIESWVEASGMSSDTDQRLRVLTHSGQSDMQQIIWFCEKYSRRTINLFLEKFPYSQDPRPKKTGSHVMHKSAVDLNLMLCDLFSHWVDRCPKLSVDPRHSILLYLLDAFTNHQLHTDNEIITLLVVIKRVLPCEYLGMVNRLLEALLKEYTKLPHSNKKKTSMLIAFESLVISPKYWQRPTQKPLSGWSLMVVDCLLYGAVTFEVLQCVRRLCSQRCIEFLESVQVTLPRILDRLETIALPPDKLEDSYKAIIELLYWIACIDQAILSKLLCLFRKQVFPIPVVSYTFKVLHGRFLKDPLCSWCIDPTHYFNFLLDAILGVSKQDLKAVRVEDVMNFEAACGFLITVEVDKVLCYHDMVFQMALKNLLASGETDMMKFLSVEFLLNYLGSFCVVPLHSGISFVFLICTLWTDIPFKLVAIAAGMCLTLMSMISKDFHQESKILDAVQKVLLSSGIQEAALNILSTVIEGVVEMEYCEFCGNILRHLVELLTVDNLNAPMIWSLLCKMECKFDAVKETDWWASTTYELSIKND